MDRRLELDDIFKSIAGEDHVYYQPPASVLMNYPAIRYERSRVNMIHADNIPYKSEIGYMVTVIDRDPDSRIVKELLKLPKCSFNRHYCANNLNHDVFIIYH